MKDVLKHTASMLGTLGTGFIVAAFFQDDGVFMPGVFAGVWIMFISVMVACLSTQYD